MTADCPIAGHDHPPPCPPPQAAPHPCRPEGHSVSSFPTALPLLASALPSSLPCSDLGEVIDLFQSVFL